MSEAADRLWALLEPYLAAEGLELDDLELAGHGRGRVLRVFIDGTNGSPSLDELSDASRGMSRLLDEEADDLFTGPYTLEVTSPGLERKLRRPEHFRKAMGQEVVVRSGRPVEGTKVHRGVLEEVDETGFFVRSQNDRRHLGFEDVASAQTVFRWERAPKPGKKRR